MLFTLQAGIAAGQRGILPDQRVSQYPEARYWLGWMQQVRLDQWRDEQLAEQLFKRCRWTYNIGIIAFISGLISLQIPAPGQWDDRYTGSVFRMVALAAVIIAILLEIVLTLNWPAGLSNWLVPGIATTESAKLEDVKNPGDVKAIESIGPDVAQRLVYGDGGPVGANGPDIGSPAEALDRIAPVLVSLAARLEDLSQAVERAVSVVRLQVEAAEADLARAHREPGQPGSSGPQHREQ
jgi:hypothetical protein